MCSNPTRGFHRLLTSTASKTFPHVRGEKALVAEFDAPRGQQVPYSPKRHLSAVQNQEIVAGYLAGSTAKTLAAQFQIDPATVSKILKANNVTMRRHPMRPNEIEQAIELYKWGLSFAKIAKIIPYHPSTIRRSLLVEQTRRPH